MKIPASVIDAWATAVDSWFAEHRPELSRASVTAARDAWFLAHRTGLWTDAYRFPGVNDAHVQTALARIFPNAVFLDAKRY